MTYKESRRMPQYFTVPDAAQGCHPNPPVLLWIATYRPVGLFPVSSAPDFRTAKHGLCEIQVSSSTAQNPSTTHKALLHDSATFPWPPPQLVPQPCYLPFHSPDGPFHASTPLGMLELSLKRLSSALVHTTHSHLSSSSVPSPEELSFSELSS